METQKTKKLYELPKGSRIYNLIPNGDPEGVIIFDHPDGMYSYCYLESDPTKVVHLSASAPLRPFRDGYEIADYDA